MLPAICPQVRKITTFIRAPTWVSPAQGMDQHLYSDEERQAFQSSPDSLLSYRKQIESGLNGLFPLFFPVSELQKNTREDMTKMMKARLQNEVMAKHLIPSWGVGCRRLTPGINYLETLSAEKVKVVFDEIKRITEEGCICGDGQEYPVDVLVCATGFDTSFCPRFPIIGSGGKNLADEWSKDIKGYFGVAIPDFPNYFVFLGPNSPVGNGPLLAAIGIFFLGDD